MWRPLGWAKIRSTWLEQNFTTGKMKQKTFEAGADALFQYLLSCGIISISQLEALNKNGDYKGKSK